jgi:hypothetical protein
MSDNPNPFGKPARSALADGAARFDVLAKDLKARQIAESHGGVVSTDYVRTAVSPDEEWARNFMTQGIGPRPELQPVQSIMPSPAMPGVVFDLTPPQAVAPKSVLPSDGFSAAHMGSVLGKPAPRRSWLGRMLKPKPRGAE